MNLLEAKIYYDGSNWIAIPHTERPYRQRRPRDRPEKSEGLQKFERRFTKVKGGRANRKAKLKPLGTVQKNDTARVQLPLELLLYFYL